jgi:Rrf2 family protein
MKLSLHSEYALLSLIYIARRPDEIVTSAKVGTSRQIPPDALNEVIATLINAKYLRLAKGNLQLAKTAEKIAVADIIRLFDGALAPLEPVSQKGYQPAPMEMEQKLAGLFTQIQDQIIVKLEDTSLADLV